MPFAEKCDHHISITSSKIRPGSRLNIKITFSSYEGYHVQDETVARPPSPGFSRLLFNLKFMVWNHVHITSFTADKIEIRIPSDWSYWYLVTLMWNKPKHTWKILMSKGVGPQFGSGLFRSISGVVWLHLVSSPNELSWHPIFGNPDRIPHSLVWFALDIRWRLTPSNI